MEVEEAIFVAEGPPRELASVVRDTSRWLCARRVVLALLDSAACWATRSFGALYYMIRCTINHKIVIYCSESNEPRETRQIGLALLPERTCWL